MFKTISNLKFWNSFYKNSFDDKNSSFSKWILQKTNNKNNIIDIGCGNGRDTFFFSKYFKNVYGADKSQIAIINNKIKAKDNYLKNILFYQKDFSKKKLL
jgi:ubiquinone/menaquinone biosynthesis C-methylase UbiE